MNVYSFFLVPSKVPKDFIFMEENSHKLRDSYDGWHPIRTLDNGEKIILYGITNKKRYMEIFRNTRDPKKIVLFKTDMEKSKYNELLKRYRLNEYEIKPEILIDGKTGVGTKDIKVLLTEFERQKVNDEIILCQMLWEYLFKNKGDGKVIYSEVFQDDVRALLKIIMYDELIKLVSDLGSNDGDIEYAELSAIEDLLKLSEGNKIKTFSVFITLFHSILK